MSNPEGNENNNTYNHIKYTDEKYLTKKAIQSAIFNAVKAKTNINLVGNGINDDTNNDVDCINNNKTGGPWSDAIWLKTNDITTTTTNNDETTTTTNQYVLGNIYDYSTREIGTYENNNQQETLNLSDNVDNVKIKTYKTITNENEETAETINNNILNISNTKLYRIPMIDGKFVLEKMLYNDISKQNLESIINKLKFEVGFTDDDIVRPENIPDIEKQRLMLCGYDIVETVNNGNPSSKIYEYEKENPNDQTIYLSYTLNNNTFSINTESSGRTYIYYPDTIYVRSIDTTYYYKDGDNVKDNTDNVGIEYSDDINKHYTYTKYILA